MTFEIPGLQKQERGQPSDGSCIVYTLSGGDALAVVNPPKDASGEYLPESGPAANALRRSLEALASVEAARRAAAEDKNLSDHGKAEKVAPVIAQAKEAAAQAKEDLAGLIANAAEARKTIFSPPPLDPTDVQGALIDQEIRNYARSLPMEDASKYADVMAKDPRHLAAILRSPVPVAMLTDHAANLWRDHVVATDPRAASLERTQQSVDWAANMLPHVVAKI